jgi:hypothetical protein
MLEEAGAVSAFSFVPLALKGQRVNSWQMVLPPV